MTVRDGRLFMSYKPDFSLYFTKKVHSTFFYLLSFNKSK